MIALHRTKSIVGRGSRLRTAAAALAWSSAPLVLAMATATPAHAQVSTASLRGRIAAPQGAMPTQVVAINVQTGVRRTAAVSTDGSYNFPALDIGTYRLEVIGPNGTRSTDEFALTVGQAATFDFDLAEAPTTTAANDIIVTGNRIKSMQGGEVGTTISRRLIEQLPQNNRNFMAFADLAPGVQFITNGSDQSRLQGGAQNSTP